MDFSPILFLSSASGIYYSLGLLSISIVSVVLYRRFFHPLSKIPGPFIPAVTRLYLWYHNVIKGGTLYKRLDELHEKYGPIVRIAPNEVHLTDPDNYEKIFSISSKFYKDPLFYGTLGVYDVMFTAINNDTHRRLRAPMSHFFSRRTVLDLEDIVQDKAKKLCRRVQESIDAGTGCDLRAGFRAVSVDVITEYAFDDCWDHLEIEDFASWFSDAVLDSGFLWWSFQQVPSLLIPIQAMPEDYARKISPAMNGWLGCAARTRDYVRKVDAQFKAGIKPRRRTIFHEILDPKTGSEDEMKTMPSQERLYGEALSFCTAAADTTGNAMEMATYHVVTNPEIYKKLFDELCAAFPDPTQDLDYATLENLPYLSGVIKEGQRLSYGVISRLARATPEGGAEFNGYFIPAGTTVSMSAWVMHRNEDVFPSPDTFDPTRWTDSDQSAVRAREKCLVPFSRGSRMCIGQNLALSELYVTLGTLFRRFDNLEAFDIGPEDMVYVDYFSAFHPRDSRPFKVAAKKK